jgi:hypothetical protein
MTRVLIIVLTAFLICSCTRDDKQIIGIKIYEYKGDFDQLAVKWESMGINTAFVSTSLAADVNFRQALKERDIKVFIIFPVFLNPEILKGDTTLYAILNTGEKARQEWVEFVCPSRIGYRNHMIRQLSGLTGELDPDGISIDFIREFTYWEKIYPERDFRTIERACYCDSCLKNFTAGIGISIPDSCISTHEKAQWIENNYSSSWNQYRCELITSMIRQLSEAAHRIKSEVMINVHVVPWRENDFGGANIRVAAQDLKEIAPLTDFISPMCYSQMLDRDAEWISDVVTDNNNRAKGMVLPSIQVYPYYIDRRFTSEDFRQCIQEALKPPSCGVVFFSWPLFEQDSARMDVVTEVMNNYSY